MAACLTALQEEDVAFRAFMLRHLRAREQIRNFWANHHARRAEPIEINCGFYMGTVRHNPKTQSHAVQQAKPTQERSKSDNGKKTTYKHKYRHQCPDVNNRANNTVFDPKPRSNRNKAEVFKRTNHQQRQFSGYTK